MYIWSENTESFETFLKEFSYFQALEIVADLEKDLQNVNETNLKAEDLLSEAEVLLTAIQGIPIKH